MSFPVFIVCRDRLTHLLGLLAWLDSVGNADEVYLIDNASTWEPLLDYYETTPYTVIRQEHNHGQRVGWTQAIIRTLASARRFVYTDPDVLPTQDCPPDALERMEAVLRKDANIVKCGFGIKIDDLAPWISDGAVAWETQMWQTYVPRLGAYRAPIDTTFALYNPCGAKRFKYKPAYRLPEPYLVRHMPWYVDLDNLDDEEAYYIAHADPKVSNYACNIMERSA